MEASNGEPQVKELTDRARARFADLTEAELKILDAAMTGETAYCGPSRDDGDPNNNPESADSWGPERDIRAKLIRWLCISRDAATWVDPRGLRIHAARISGQLDLSFSVVRVPLALLRCRIAGALNLPFAQIEFLSLPGSLVHGLVADGMRVRGSLNLRNGFRADGEVRLLDADIGGNLDCDCGKFVRPDGCALNADGAKVAGYVFLRNGFSAEGEVRLLGADIGSSLECDNGKFAKPDGRALNVDKVKVGGSVFLRSGFSAEGEVNLLGADIGSNLECEGGKFVKPDGQALNADGVKVAGSVFLRNGFGAEGEVRLLGANIGGDLSCIGGKFVKSDGYALGADRVKVAGSVFLRNGFSADGEVRLVGADIGGNLDCDGGKFVKPDGNTLSADGAKVAGNVFMRDRFRAEGEVRLPGADIGGDLAVMNAAFAVGSRFNAERATVKGVLFWMGLARDEMGLKRDVNATLILAHASMGVIADEGHSWPVRGNLNLDGFLYTRIGAGPTDAKSRLCWLARQPPARFTPQPYQQLAKVLREAGDNVGARRVLIAMENLRRKHGNLNLQWLWRWVLRLTIGYGYRPWYALIWALVFVALGSGLFWRYSALITPSDKATYEEMHLASGNCTADAPDYYQSFSPVVYSLDVFLPIINFGQKDRWMPNAHCGSTLKLPWAWLAKLIPGWMTAGWLLRLYLWLHIGLGWLLTTLFVAGLTPIVRSG
jgi:sRNA-binding regulator protein Hfq